MYVLLTYAVMKYILLAHVEYDFDRISQKLRIYHGFSALCRLLFHAIHTYFGMLNYCNWFALILFWAFLYGYSFNKNLNKKRHLPIHYLGKKAISDRVYSFINQFTNISVLNIQRIIVVALLSIVLITYFYDFDMYVIDYVQNLKSYLYE